ncbi:MAG: hypothetical protein KF767_10355 [Bdellovibrionaceae bacterium]|nr:hypothetical protein [Pseudobdellovibrionaceae bacterium]
MKSQLFALALLAPALAWSSGTKHLSGVDSRGQSCHVEIEGSGESMSMNLKFKDYKFMNLTLENGGSRFETTTMDYGDGVYARVIGAPITISSVGLIHVKGTTDMNSAGQISKVEMSGRGGLLSWWSRSFSCKDLR